MYPTMLIDYENVPAGKHGWICSEFVNTADLEFGAAIACHVKFLSLFPGLWASQKTPYHFEEVWQFICPLGCLSTLAWGSRYVHHARFPCSERYAFLWLQRWRSTIREPFLVKNHKDKRVMLSYSVHFEVTKKDQRDSMTRSSVFYDSDWFVLVYLTSPSCTFHATNSKVSNVIAASHWQNREPWISKSQRLVK